MRDESDGQRELSWWEDAWMRGRVDAIEDERDGHTTAAWRGAVA